MNDAGIILGITIILVALGGILPLLNAEFGTSYSNYSLGSSSEAASELQGSGSGVVSAPSGVLASIKGAAVMFFWSFDVPWYINVFLLEPLRLVLYFIIARNIWIGGGG
jgi:hypothetical protein